MSEPAPAIRLTFEVPTIEGVSPEQFIGVPFTSPDGRRCGRVVAAHVHAYRPDTTVVEVEADETVGPMLSVSTDYSLDPAAPREVRMIPSWLTPAQNTSTPQHPPTEGSNP